MENIIAENLLLVCSICLDSISNQEERSMAKLKCGHKFHLDCIGSAFNMKGAMMCPNCRNVEDGTWLYANTSTSSSSDFSNYDREQDIYDYLFTDNISTFRGMTGDSSFEQVQSSPTLYRELPGNHSIFAERMDSSPLAHSYVHVPPIPGAIYHAMNVQYQSWGRHLPPLSATRNLLNGVNHVLDPSTLRFTRVDRNAMSRFGPSALPFHYGDSSFPGGRSLFLSSLNHPESITHPHERIQFSHAGHHPQGSPTSLISPIMLGARRFSGPMGLFASTPAPPTGLTSPIMPGARRFSGPMGMPVWTQAPPQVGFYIFPRPGSQNLHLENRNHLSRFPIMSSDREWGWESG